MKQAGVGHLVFNSVGGADRNSNIPHFDSKYKVEQYIASTKIPHTIVAPVFFMDNWFAPWFLPSIQEGTLKFAMPADRPLQQVSVDNIGAFSAAMIERREKVFGKRFDIAGDELTGKETVERQSPKPAGVTSDTKVSIPNSCGPTMPTLPKCSSWFNKVGYSADIKNLKKEFPGSVHGKTLKQWAQQQDWSVLK